MERSLEKCTDIHYDIAVIGGGIHGAAVAFHGSRAGFSTLLLEREDFAGATSANSLKILHGGLRYLQHLNIRRMRQSICSRREMTLLAPHLVRPLACLMPAYGYGIRGREIMRIALLLNDIIGWDRNRGVDPDVRLAGGKIIDRESCMAAIPGIAAENLRGGIVWHDALSLNTERMVLEYILAAAEAGGKAVNYAEVTHLEKEPDSGGELTVRDRISGKEYSIRAKCIVNAAGPWLENLSAAGETGLQKMTRYALALNIVVNRPLFPHYATALEGSLGYEDREALIKRGKRLYFFVPWRGSTMIGTNYRLCEESADSFEVRREDIHSMVDEVNRIYGGAGLSYSDVTFYHSGLLPIAKDMDENSESIQLEKHSRIIDHGESCFSGLFSMRSVKYTTAPSLAEEVITRVRKKTAPSLLKRNGAAVTDKPAAAAKVSGPVCMVYLEDKYGKQAGAVAAYLDGSEGCEAWISTDPPLLRAEVEYCIAEEMALTLEDIVLRRTDLGTVKCPPVDILERVASLMAEKLGWKSERKLQEIDLVISRYSLLVHYEGGKG